MPLTYEHLTVRAREFLADTLSRLASAGLDIQNWSIDHLCYRVESRDRYAELRSVFSRLGRLLGETEVKGRPIATFKLHDPIHQGNRVVDLIELPAPKPGRACAEGFEHLEIILPVPFAQLLSQYPDLRFETGGLNDDFNQVLKLSLGGVTVKFHHLSLESVINLEENAPVHEALRSCRILKTLRPYEPLIAGTFPLNLHTADSDVDIIASAHDPRAPQADLRRVYGELETFRDEMTTVGGRATYIARFVWDDVPFEVFVQDIPSVRGTAYRHYLIEERLLKTQGPEFAKRVKALRAEHHLKTEPAFAMALGLKGDPYEALLRLEDEPELGGRAGEA